MAEAINQELEPPKLKIVNGEPDVSSLADLLEWFLNFDERTARMRLAYTEELFQWKQSNDEANGIGTYPFENAEARFAVGAIQALKENSSEPQLQIWITEVLEALGAAREMKTEMSNAYRLDDADPEAFALKKAEKLTTTNEKRLYLSNCWFEVLYTAEARFLGYVYQELYGRPFAPATI
ncbi:MAG: hypothetical protein KA956_01550 [Pyrinomonadaceae bacterium]|nr:hypothetical protein [Acidobacteriota bacterium]MBP7375139.1 hypothetical protein [Pyrinomonadaceae bacterium]